MYSPNPLYNQAMQNSRNCFMDILYSTLYLIFLGLLFLYYFFILLRKFFVINTRTKNQPRISIPKKLLLISVPQPGEGASLSWNLWRLARTFSINKYTLHMELEDRLFIIRVCFYLKFCVFLELNFHY